MSDSSPSPGRRVRRHLHSPRAAPDTDANLARVRARDTDWDGVRLHVVTGKGGTGKTTVAASLALAQAAGGRKDKQIEVEARQRNDKTGRFIYDAVVMDAPPTGRISRFLNVNTEVAGRAKMGPIRHHADTVMKVIRSPETAVHFVTLLEEMPVQETVDGIAALRAIGLPVGGLMVNMVRPPILPEADLSAALAGELDVEAIRMGI